MFRSSAKHYYVRLILCYQLFWGKLLKTNAIISSPVLSWYAIIGFSGLKCHINPHLKTLLLIS